MIVFWEVGLFQLVFLELHAFTAPLVSPLAARSLQSYTIVDTLRVLAEKGVGPSH